VPLSGVAGRFFKTLNAQITHDQIYLAFAPLCNGQWLTGEEPLHQPNSVPARRGGLGSSGSGRARQIVSRNSRAVHSEGPDPLPVLVVRSWRSLCVPQRLSKGST